MMPGMDGLELYQEIKRVSPETVAVVTTAYVNHPRAEESLDAGVWKLVPKPVDLPHLLALVDEALNQPVVLIVDDDTELCLNLWDILRARHYRVGMVHSTLSLQDRLGHGETCQVVVVDLQLPDGDGREVLRWIQQLDCHPRTILITGHRQEFGPEQVLGAGADAVCYKPFDIPQLITTVERLSRIVPGTPPTSHEHAAQDTCH
jgi:DNA-binding NtrC family response regulator